MEPDLTELAAAKLVESHGPDALRILEERAETATELHHNVAARTWRAMAEAAARLLDIEERAGGLPATAREQPFRHAPRLPRPI
jgi:hypothetical protein